MLKIENYFDMYALESYLWVKVSEHAFLLTRCMLNLVGRTLAQNSIVENWI